MSSKRRKILDILPLLCTSDLRNVSHPAEWTHIYQPVMIRALLGNGGRLSTRDIAREILMYDISQIEYYENVVNNMVGRVLLNRGVVEKKNGVYELVDFNLLSDEVRRLIVEECDLKIIRAMRRSGIWMIRIIGILFENNLAMAFHDNYPVTKGHILLVPKRHVWEYFDLYQAEINAIHELLLKAKKELQLIDPSITGFNIGINNGKDAGQTIFHCHVHLIPRRKGDVDDPTGGVRNLIPGKGNYRLK